MSSAQPSNRIYYFLGDEAAFRMSPYYRNYASDLVIPSSVNNEPPQQDTDKRTPMKKNYDRNCFFSPVQCMLSYNTKTHHDAYYGRK
ncbi:hypothetical protein FO519_001757 [Halicephalobus sp. NKZ332]|nr:hypothetical protein FO519_001757 [Halicephalobus sp. NKZ332]